MNKIELLSRDGVEEYSPVRRLELRSPPKAAKLLLCVWGYHYVRQFLEFGLPTLLARHCRAASISYVTRQNIDLVHFNLSACIRLML